jgi:hypothetical protein
MASPVDGFFLRRLIAHVETLALVRDTVDNHVSGIGLFPISGKHPFHICAVGSGHVGGYFAADR